MIGKQNVPQTYQFFVFFQNYLISNYAPIICNFYIFNYDIGLQFFPKKNNSKRTESNFNSRMNTFLKCFVFPIASKFCQETWNKTMIFFNYTKSPLKRMFYRKTYTSLAIHPKPKERIKGSNSVAMVCTEPEYYCQRYAQVHYILVVHGKFHRKSKYRLRENKYSVTSNLSIPADREQNITLFPCPVTLEGNRQTHHVY